MTPKQLEARRGAPFGVCAHLQKQFPVAMGGIRDIFVTTPAG